MSIKQEVVKTSKVVLLLLRLEKRNANHQKREKQSVSVKLLIKLQWKKKETWKKARLLSELETNNLHMKCINSNVCKKIN